MHPSELDLNAYADDEIGGVERGEIERHLAACDQCRELVADLGALRRQAAALEPMTPPARAWHRIEIAAEQAERVPVPTAAAARASAFLWPSLAAAALVLLSFGVGWRLARRPVHPAPATEKAVASVETANATAVANVISATGAGAVAQSAAATATAASAIAESSALPVESELRQSEQHYGVAIAGLERIAHAEQGALDSRTAATLKNNLSVIDHAINESRAALDAQPHSEAAQQSLLESFKAKISLLQDTIALINEVRKGNGAGAAQIASGLNHKR